MQENTYYDDHTNYLLFSIISLTIMLKVVLASVEPVSLHICIAQTSNNTNIVNQSIQTWFHQTNSKQPLRSQRFAKPDTNIPNKIIFYHRT